MSPADTFRLLAYALVLMAVTSVGGLILAVLALRLLSASSWVRLHRELRRVKARLEDLEAAQPIVPPPGLERPSLLDIWPTHDATVQFDRQAT